MSRLLSLESWLDDQQRYATNSIDAVEAVRSGEIKVDVHDFRVMMRNHARMVDAIRLLTTGRTDDEKVMVERVLRGRDEFVPK